VWSNAEAPSLQLPSCRKARLAAMLDEREVAQHLLQSDDLTRNKLCNSQADDLGDGTHIFDESSHFMARQAVRLCTKTEDDLVAIHDIDIEMNGNTRASRRLEPIEKRLTDSALMVRMGECSSGMDIKRFV
jgi:hypothetical protein